MNWRMKGFFFYEVMKVRRKMSLDIKWKKNIGIENVHIRPHWDTVIY